MILLSKLGVRIDVLIPSHSFSEYELVVRETNRPTSVNSVVDQKNI